MLALALITIAGFTSVRAFNVTHLIVPEVVPPKQETVDIECRYEGNFTILMWFKDRNEFFRYKPGAAPSTRSFPVLGVGTVDLLFCGPTSCRLRLGALTEEASGLYKCDIERQIRPYKFASSNAYMQVYGHIVRKPLVEGLGPEFGEGDEIRAYCRTAPGSELRWYINGKEEENMRGSPSLCVISSRLMFLGLPPTVSVQCAEYKNGRLYGSKDMKAHWKAPGQGTSSQAGVVCDETAQEQRNRTNSLVNCLVLVFVLCLTSIKLL